MGVETLKRILYVEDEADIRLVASIALESVGGFELVICESGPEALAKAVAFAPQLLLLDIMMPQMDGPTTLKALRALPSLASVPAIFMTAKAQASEIATFKGLGAIDVITKPFDPMTLSDVIKDSWAKFQEGR